MIRINCITEGQSEEAVVREVLAPELGSAGLGLIARSVETGRTGPRIHRGGMTSFAKAQRDIKRWLAQDPTAYVTTWFDLYRLPTDFPGSAEAQQQADPYRRTDLLEQAFARVIGNPRFIPYLQIHEFEGLLFTDPAAMDRMLAVRSSPSQLAQLRAIRSDKANPELINDGPTTAPSKRIIALFPGYEKITSGVRILRSIGLPTLCSACPHFGEWIKRLRNLTAPLA